MSLQQNLQNNESKILICTRENGTVILGRDEASLCALMNARLVVTTVTVRQLECLSSDGQGQQLVA
jgi:hypothetical protein